MKPLLQPLDERERFGELRKARFFRFELGGMNTSAYAARPHRVLEMKHFMVEQVLDCIAWTGGPVEDAAHDNGVMRRVVVAKRAFGVVLAPSEVRAAEQPAEETQVQRVEDFFEMVVATLGPKVALAAACGANEFGLPRHGSAGCKALEAQVMSAVNRLAVKLGEKDVRDRMDNALRRAFEKIGKACVDFTVADANGRVERCESPEAHMNGGHGRARPKEAILLFENWTGIGGHRFELSRQAQSEIEGNSALTLARRDPALSHRGEP